MYHCFSIYIPELNRFCLFWINSSEACAQSSRRPGSHPVAFYHTEFICQFWFSRVCTCGCLFFFFFPQILQYQENCAAAKSLFSSFCLSPECLQTELLPYLAKLANPMRNEGKISVTLGFRLPLPPRY